MLTNHCYDHIGNNWDVRDGKRSIRDCCITTNPEDPTCSDCCYDEWQDKLKSISQDYKKAGEEADQVKKRLVFITDRRDRYRTWVTELNKTEDKARLICHQLEIIISQSDKIWYNARKAAEAIEILFCMIRDFYFRVDYLKKRYDDLQACLAVNHDPSLVKGQGILKYLEEYSQKLDTVIKTRDDIVKAVLEAIKISHLISNNISTDQRPLDDPSNPYNPCAPNGDPCPDCSDPQKRFYGFKTIICEWHRELKCAEDCIKIDPCADKDQEQSQQQQQRNFQGGYSQMQKNDKDDDAECEDPQEEPDECGDTNENCRLRPVFRFPICNDKYKLKVDNWLEKDEDTVACLTNKLKKLNKRKESLQACRDSLVKAIAEVDPKERCK